MLSPVIVRMASSSRVKNSQFSFSSANNVVKALLSVAISFWAGTIPCCFVGNVSSNIVVSFWDLNKKRFNYPFSKHLQKRLVSAITTDTRGWTYNIFMMQRQKKPNTFGSLRAFLLFELLWELQIWELFLNCQNILPTFFAFNWRKIILDFIL